MKPPVMTRTVIPAQLGWYVATFVPRENNEDERKDFLWFHPIVAWEIEREEGSFNHRGEPVDYVDHVARPITLRGSITMPDDVWVIKSPDGLYQSECADTQYNSEMAAIAGLRMRWEYIATKRKQQAATTAGQAGAGMPQVPQKGA